MVAAFTSTYREAATRTCWMSHPNSRMLPSWELLETRPKDPTAGVLFNLEAGSSEESNDEAGSI